MYIHTPDTMSPTYIQHMVKEISPPIEDILGIFSQITILIIYYINSSLVYFINLIYAS